VFAKLGITSRRDLHNTSPPPSQHTPRTWSGPPHHRLPRSCTSCAAPPTGRPHTNLDSPGAGRATHPPHACRPGLFSTGSEVLAEARS